MKETIGNRITKYRKAKGMTQEELAAQMGVSSQAVSKWETDASCPDISLLPQLCRILGITTDTLLTGKNDEVRLVPENKRKPMEELVLRIHVHSVDGDKIRVNLPLSVVQLGVEMGVNLSASFGGKEALKDIDFSQVIALAQQGMLGKLVEIESADGDIVEVVVE